MRCMTPFALAALLAALALTPPAAASSDPSDAWDAQDGSGAWWSESVWDDPDRPFLYYGDPGRDGRGKDGGTAPKAEASGPDDFLRLRTMAEVRAEHAARLDRAVMNPTDENVRAFLAINAFALEKAQGFSDAFDRGRIARPAFDWTAAHPSANFATAELGGLREAADERRLAAVGRDAGIIFIGGASSEENALALGPVRAFALSMGSDLLVVAPTAPVPGAEALADNGVAERILEGSPDLPTVASPAGGRAPERPAAALLARPGAAHPALRSLGRRPLLFSSGVRSVSELRRRLLVLLGAGAGAGRAVQTGPAGSAPSKGSAGFAFSASLNETLP